MEKELNELLVLINELALTMFQEADEQEYKGEEVDKTKLETLDQIVDELTAIIAKYCSKAYHS